MADNSVSSSEQTLVAQADNTVFTIDPDSGEGRVSVQPGSSVQLDAFDLAGSTISRDGGELLVATEQGTTLRFSGLTDEQVVFADGAVDGTTLSALADLQPTGETTIAAVDGDQGPISVSVEPRQSIDFAEAGISSAEASLADGNQIVVQHDGREIQLVDMAGQSLTFTEGTLSGSEAVALLAARRAGLGESDLDLDLSDGNAEIEVMTGVPVDLSPLSSESVTVAQNVDGFAITLADGSRIDVVGLDAEPVVFSDTILRSEDLIALADAGAATPVAQATAVDVPATAAVADGDEIVVDVVSGQPVDLSEYSLADSTVVLDGDDVVISLADGRTLRLVGLDNEPVQFADAALPGAQFAALAGDASPALIAPAAGPAAGAAAPAAAAAGPGPAGQQGGGTVVNAQEQGAIGDPLPLASLIDPTELAFSGIDPDPGVGEEDGDGDGGPAGDGDDPGDPGGGPGPGDDPLQPVPVAYNAQIPVSDGPVAPQAGSGASATVPIDIGDDGPGAGTDPTADRDSNDIGDELVGIDENDGRILDGLLVVDLPRFGTLLYDFDDGTGLTPITENMILGGDEETVFPIESGNDFIYQAHGVYGDGAATWQRAIDDGIVSSITANAIGGDDAFVLAEVSNADGAGNLDNTNALGVVGNTTYQDRVDAQLGHDSRAGTGSDLNVSTEGLRIDFAVDIAQMNFDVSHLFADEWQPGGQPPGSEVGRWTAYNVDGAGNAVAVATDTFTGTDPVGNSQTRGALEIAVDAGVTFNRIEFTALPYSNAPDVPEPTGPNNYESSDYQVSNISVLPADGDSFRYTTFVDNNANEAYDPGVDAIAETPATVYLDTEIV